MIHVDLFAGLGGMSEGAEQAGSVTAWAGNHWPFAVDVHRLNHPHARHDVADMHAMDWRLVGEAVRAHRERVAPARPASPFPNLIVAGPACQGHSKAGRRHRSGSAQIKHDTDRATALAVINAVECLRPRWSVTENVPEWLEWELFPSWLDMLHRLGYATETLRLWAHHYGAPQMRERVFVVATLEGGDALRRAVEGIRARVVPESQRLTVGDIARWDEGKWRPVEQCGNRAGSRGGKSKESSRDRILRGLDLGVDQWWAQHVTGHKGKPIDTPLSTLTGGDQHVLCRRSDRSKLGIEYRPLLIREMLAVQGFPEHYKLPPKLERKHACRAIGNAVAVPVARAIAESIMEAST